MKGYGERISGWLSPENLSEAKGKSREEIFAWFGNEYEPIAEIGHEYLKHLRSDVTDAKVYSGKGYFIDHAVNHHPEVGLDEYGKIPDILSDPDDVRLDIRRDRASLVFMKKYERLGLVIVSHVENDGGRIVVYKTFFNKTGKKSPYTHFQSVRAESPDVAPSSISRTGNPAPGGKRDVSALGDTPSVSSESAGKSSDRVA